MIPDPILEFLQGASAGFCGTRDHALVPFVHRMSGWRVEEDGATLRCFFPREFLRGLVENVEDNGRISVTIERIGAHETYQFKGRYLDSAPCDEADLEAYARSCERLVDAVTAYHGFSREASRGYALPPVRTIRFRVEEIYNQTPGPGAGRRIVPPEEER